MTRRRALLFALLAIGAVARLLLQLAPMPPYAGLDEIYHVARVVFTAREGRNPTINEPSVPRYLERSIRQEAVAPPAFGIIAERWPEVVASGATMPRDVQPSGDELRYTMANYEAQQPSLYYTIAALLVRNQTPMGELRALRLFSLLFAMIAIAATAHLGYTRFGDAGLLAALLLASVPTWLTLVARASNDAMACALIACGFALSARGRHAVAEGIVWALAVATKLYAAPALAAVLVFWWLQRASRKRIIIVILCCAIAGAVLLVDFHQRTRNPIGLFPFDPAQQNAKANIDWIETAKVFISTLAWTSGQHWNALTPVGFVALFVPLALMVGAAGLAPPTRRTTGGASPAAPLLFAGIAFAVSQIVMLAAFLRDAHAPIPGGGKEGWYWYSLAAPLFATIVAALPRRTAIIFAAWLLAFDISAHEGALFRDWRGATTPAHRGTFFRWGESGAMPANRFAVGPLADHAGALRAIHLIALLALLSFPTAWPSVLPRGRAPEAEPASRAA